MAIDYGIYIGTTAASIAKMENGIPVILKSDTLKDTMPVCVYFNRKGVIQVGDAAFINHNIEVINKQKDWEETAKNSFVEFTRTLGTDKLYNSANTNQSFSSEELLAEVIKALLSFEKDRNVKAAVMTIPAVYKQNQIDAVRRAGKMAGLVQIQLLQEPIAAGIAYGLNSKKKDGFWLVFDFGGGTFDSALLKVEDGIMKVADTEGDNYLGGKNLDMAIVDEIIMPYLVENYAIDSILEDDAKKQILRNAMKFYAEETKIKLSFNDTHNVLSDKGDIPGEDDNGEEFELDITITQKDMERALAPIFQKAINICKTLLERNNLKGSSLDSLILVGGPTFSPVLRKMLEQQICIPDTSVDPMTVVSKGAALYASTVAVSEEVKEQTRDKSKIQIEIGHEASSVEMEEFVTLKILVDKTEGNIPEKVFAEITRSDKAWSSGKVEINDIGEVIETQLVEGKTNSFDVALYDDKGKLLESEPNEFTIIQGIEGLNEMQGLTLNWGIEKQDKRTGKITFYTIPGLEKNKSLPAVGTVNGLKTQKQIRPGMDSDFIKIPLYQGEHGADGTRAIYNEHVFDIIISGADLPALLPENSDVVLTIHIDKTQKVSIQAYFPYLNYTTEINVITNTVKPIETNWLANEIRKAKGSIEELQEDNNTSTKLHKAEAEIEALEQKFNNNREDVDNKQQVLTNLRKTLKTIDELSEANEWPKLEIQVKEAFYHLEKTIQDFGHEKNFQLVNQLRKQLEEFFRTQDIKVGYALLEEIISIKLPVASFGVVEDYLYHLTEENLIDSTIFQLYFEKLFEIKENPKTEILEEIYKELKNYGKNE